MIPGDFPSRAARPGHHLATNWFARGYACLGRRRGSREAERPGPSPQRRLLAPGRVRRGCCYHRARPARRVSNPDRAENLADARGTKAGLLAISVKPSRRGPIKPSKKHPLDARINTREKQALGEIASNGPSMGRGRPRLFTIFYGSSHRCDRGIQSFIDSRPWRPAVSVLPRPSADRPPRL